MPLSKIDSDSLNTGAVTSTALASGVPTRAQMPVGSVLQVVSVNTLLSFSSTSSSYVSIGLTASITPTSATSKILVVTQNPTATESSNMVFTTALYRNSGEVFSFNAQYAASAGYLATTAAFNYLDSPATTSSTTYTIYARVAAGSGTISSGQPAVITLMEIAA
jgi:hypothetical protein